MNRTLRRQKLMSIPLALSWSHCGALYRVTPWPDVQFEIQHGSEWVPCTPDDDALQAAALVCGRLEWAPYLEFTPPAVRDILLQFGFARMEALQVMARCPALIETLSTTPALSAFIAAQVSLHGAASAWREIAAIFERNAIFGLLEWLGLPASRQTLAVLQNLAQPDIPRRLLEPLRSLLWEPTAIFALQRIPAITDRDLVRYCHALAA